MRLRFLYLVCILCSIRSGAQIFPFKTYTVKDGLTSSQVLTANRDSRGILWIGTAFGVNWFDGQKFTEIDIPARAGQLYVTNIITEPDGALWILTFYNGIYRYQNNRFQNFLIDSVHIESNANNVFEMIRYDDKNYLLATDNNIFWFDGKKFKLFDPSNPQLGIQFRAASFVGSDHVLLGCSQGLFMYYKKGSVWEQLPTALPHREINKIFVNNGKIWIGTGHELLIYDNVEGILANKPSQTLFSGSIIGGISRNDQTGDIWVSADKLYKFHNDQLISYTSRNGLPALPYTVFCDKENISWLCSMAGLTKLVNENYLYHDLTKTSIHPWITSLVKDEKGQVWMGTFYGLGRKNGDEFTRIVNTSDGKPLGFISWLSYQGENKFYAGTGAGIVHIENGSIKVVAPVVSTKMYEEANGTIWMGTLNGGLYSFANNKVTTLKPSRNLPDFIDGLQKDRQGNLWVGYRGFGIIKYQVKGDSLIVAKEYSTNTGYPNLRVRCAFGDRDGNIIFGTRTNGIFVISGNDDSKTWNVNSSHGLTGSWVSSIEQDERGNIYLATNKGLNVLSNSYNNPSIRRITIQTENIAEKMTFVYNDKDKLFIGAEGGIVEYFMVKDQQQTHRPLVYLTELSINGKQDSSFTPYSIVHGKKNLDHKTSVIAFEFTGIDMHEDQPMKYSYKLVGQDDDWTSESERNFVSYNLLPGNYTFLVRARNSSGEWSEEPASFKFEIAAPFWTKWWFIAGIALAVISLSFIVYRYRINQKLKLEKLRSRISNDLHDDIGSTLSSISILSEMALTGKNKNDSDEMMLEIKQNSVSLMEKMDDIVWSINPKNDTLENLLVRIRSFAAKLFEAKNVEYSITIDESVKHAKLSMESRQHIYLMLKEAINNTVKYSGCTRASIDIQYRHGLLKIVVQDNGKGFDVEKVNRGNGLLSMKHRAQLMSADISIGSTPGKGTTILWESKIK